MGKKIKLVEVAGQPLTKTGLAKKLGVARSSLYYRHRQPEKDIELKRRIEEVLQKHHGYGHRRIAQELVINKKRIRRVMRKYGIKPPRRCTEGFTKPGDIGNEAADFPDITARVCPIEPGVMWVSDFTYIWFHDRFVYVATVMDSFTREIVGAYVMLHHNTELVMKAFLDAYNKIGIVPVWAHSDQGSEYNSQEYLGTLQKLGVGISMSPKSSPWRNGHQESFFGRFKIEFGDPERFDTVPELIEAIFAQLKYYNSDRIHSAFGTPPRTFAIRWQLKRKEIGRNRTMFFQGPPGGTLT